MGSELGCAKNRHVHNAACAPSVQVNSTLEVLEAPSNGIDAEGALILAAGISRNVSLTCIE
jgi:hypothetical protein